MNIHYSYKRPELKKEQLTSCNSLTSSLFSLSESSLSEARVWSDSSSESSIKLIALLTLLVWLKLLLFWLELRFLFLKEEFSSDELDSSSEILILKSAIGVWAVWRGFREGGVAGGWLTDDELTLLESPKSKPEPPRFDCECRTLLDGVFWKILLGYVTFHMYKNITS